MTPPLNVQLSEQAYGELLKQARNVGLSPDVLASQALEKYFGKPKVQLTEEEKEAARKKFRSMFGSWGHAGPADNASIDADIVRAIQDDL